MIIFIVIVLIMIIPLIILTLITFITISSLSTHIIIVVQIFNNHSNSLSLNSRSSFVIEYFWDLCVIKQEFSVEWWRDCEGIEGERELTDVCPYCSPVDDAACAHVEEDPPVGRGPIVPQVRCLDPPAGLALAPALQLSGQDQATEGKRFPLSFLWWKSQGLPWALLTILWDAVMHLRYQPKCMEKECVREVRIN